MTDTLATTTPTAPTETRRHRPDWRWRRVVAAVRRGDRITRDFSEVEANAVRLLRALQRGKTDLAWRNAVRQHTDVALAIAASFHPRRRVTLELWALAGQSADATAGNMGPPPAVVRAFRELFFDVPKDKHDDLQMPSPKSGGPGSLTAALGYFAHYLGKAIVPPAVDYLKNAGEEHDLTTTAGRQRERMKLMITAWRLAQNSADRDEAYEICVRLLSALLRDVDRNATGSRDEELSDMLADKMDVVWLWHNALQGIESGGDLPHAAMAPDDEALSRELPGSLQALGARVEALEAAEANVGHDVSPTVPRGDTAHSGGPRAHPETLYDVSLHAVLEERHLRSPTHQTITQQTAMSMQIRPHRRPHPRTDATVSRAEQQILRLMTILQNPSADLADGDRELRRMRLPKGTTSFAKIAWNHLRTAFRDVLHFRTLARQNFGTPAAGAQWNDTLNKLERRFENAAGFFLQVFNGSS